jgi:hypothetical protein
MAPAGRLALESLGCTGQIEQTNKRKNKMKLHYIACVAAVLLASTQAPYATPISGAIGFAGGAALNSSSASSATGVTGWITPSVTLVSGAFAAPSVFAITPGTAIAFAPGAWNFNTSTPINNFWSVGGFSFSLLSSSITSQGGIPGSTGYVAVNGTGTISGNGYTATPMSWDFTSQDPKTGSGPDTWTFSASGNTAPPSVPDGASTAILFGVALASLTLFKRKLMA